MNVSELRAHLKERGIKGYSTMKRAELRAKVQALEAQERLRKYEEDLRHNVVCSACLEQQRIQRKIDEKTQSERLLGLMVRNLVCEYCKHPNLTQDGDDTVCVLCGGLQSPDTHVVL